MNRDRNGQNAVSHRFRKELLGELRDWVEEGLLSESQSALLGKRYDLDRFASRTPSSLLVPIIYSLGVLLIGGGAISFVAAHWDSIPAYIRVAMLVTAMLVCEGTGYYLWKIKGRERLGQGLLTLGTLIFGANIFLIAQIYHVQGEFHNAFGAWALGAVAMAYATRSRPAIWIACITSFIWFCGWADLNPHAFSWYPFVLILFCLPFVMRGCEVTFYLLLLATGISVIIGSGLDGDSFWSVAIAWIGVALLTYGVGIVMTGKESWAPLAPFARVLGLFGFLLLSYSLAFLDPAEHLVKKLWEAQGWLWLIPVATVYLASAAVWTRALISAPEEGGMAVTPRVVLVCFLLLLSGIGTGRPILLAVAANLATLGIAAGLIWDSVVHLQRKAFWCGISLFVLVALSRFLEWETHLITKSLVFIACGLLLVWGGTRFEAHLKKKAQS